MFTVIGLMMTGILTGYLLRKKNLNKISSIITLLIWILLFLLGIEVGSNRQIIEALGTLGIEAAVITFFAILGSCTAAWGLWRLLYKRKEKEA